jgi:ABC-2 type transport system permease protein
MINEILAVAWKDLKLLSKVKGELAAMFLLPLLIAMVMAAPLAQAQETQETRLYGEAAFVAEAFLVNEDSGNFGKQVASVLRNLPMTRIRTLDSVTEADQRVADGERPVAIVIPADFTAKIETNEPTTVLLITDPTQGYLARFFAGIVNQALAEVSVLGEIQYGIRAVLDQSGILEGADPALRQAAEAQALGVVWTQVQEMRENPVITVRSEALKGAEIEEGIDPYAFYVPGSAVMFAFFLVTVIAPALLREKEQGSFRRLLASPMRHSSIIGGTLLAYSIVVFLQVIVIFTVGIVVFHMPLGESPLALLLATLFTALTVSSLGLLVGTVAKTSQQAFNIGMLAGFVLAAVGGAIVALYQKEGFISLLSNLTPHAHALKAYRGVMVYNATLVEVLPSLGILALFAAVLFGVAVWRFKFE